MEQPILKQVKDQSESYDVGRKDTKGEDDKDYEEVSNDNQDHEFMFKMHKGLVKIQALIRGHLTRLNFKKNQIQKQNKFINR